MFIGFKLIIIISLFSNGKAHPKIEWRKKIFILLTIIITKMKKY